MQLTALHVAADRRALADVTAAHETQVHTGRCFVDVAELSGIAITRTLRLKPQR